MSTVQVINVKHPSSASNNIVLDSSGNASMAGTMAMATPFAMRNKIINGAMMIDQRNAGASVTPTDGVYTLDRWYGWANQNSKYTVQQNAASVTPPVGFTNYLGVTSSSAYSVLTGDYFGIVQAIEGLNVQDLAWGTASAKMVTLSFWVRSSLTGTFGGVVQNGGQTRSYPFSYTISSANTWEYKTITIAGDTSGTWLTTNGVGVRLAFGLGAGATYSGTANAWANANYVTSTGATSVVGTNGATWYITGVQFEVGSVATPFEFRLYSQEMLFCQRYYWKTYAYATVPGTATGDGLLIFTRWNDAGNTSFNSIQNPAYMRTGPTVTAYNTNVGSGSWFDNGAIARTVTISYQVPTSFTVQTTGSGATTTGQIYGHIVASAEL